MIEWANSLTPDGCRGVEPDLNGYADRSLSGRRTAEVEAHLRLCATCRQTLHDIGELRAMLGATRAPAVAPSALESRLVTIAGADSREPLWIAPATGPARLPSAREQRRKIAAFMTVAAVLTVMALAAGGWMMAPQLDEIRDPQRMALREFSASVPNSAVSQATSALLIANDRGVNLERPAQIWRRPDYGTSIPIPAQQARALLDAASSPVTAYQGSVQVSMALSSGIVRGVAQVSDNLGVGVHTWVLDESGHVAVQGSVPKGAYIRALLGSSDPVSRFAIVPGAWKVAGVHVLLLESYGLAGQLTHRWWINPNLGLVLATESFSRDGQVVHQGSFTKLSLGSLPTIQQVSMPQLVFSRAATPLGNRQELCQTWACPRTLGGLPLVSISTDSGARPSMVHSVYSDGAVTISVVQQRGRLAPKGSRANQFERLGGPDVWSWQSGDTVITVASDAPWLVSRRACAELPHLAPANDSVFSRIGAGLQRMIGR